MIQGGKFEMTFSDETDRLILNPNPIVHTYNLEPIE